MTAAELHLGPHRARVERRLESWRRDGFHRRIWERDPKLWSERPIPELADRLGWLDLPEAAVGGAAGAAELAGEVRREGLEDVVLLGMGGSSLAPEVFQRTFGNAPGHPRLRVADSTHPDAVRALERDLDPSRALFIVSSKSGSTLETRSLADYFWSAVAAAPDPGSRFVAITDPGSGLERRAGERGFRRVFRAPPDVGGRFSALSEFGLVPAALIGADVSGLVTAAQGMADRCRAEASNPGLELGAALAELALAGVDKLTLLTSPRLASFPDWLEQLVAESTGKEGVGIVPVAHEPPAELDAYGEDRFLVGLTLDGDPAAELQRLLDSAAAAGRPAARLRLAAATDLGAEIFRWEMATAAAGAALGINPFDQPDVEVAKRLAAQAMAGSGTRPAGVPQVSAADAPALERAAAEWLGSRRPGDYFALLAYLPAAPEIEAGLRRLQGGLRRRTGLAATAGYGPRFLHSTGQLHKGGPDSGLFLQLVDTPSAELPVPGRDYGFGRLIAGQADGDLAALAERGRRVLRVLLGADSAAGLERLAAVLTG